MGRLYDLDVLSPGGEKLSRPQSRRCLICGGPVTVCSRSRAHGLAAIQAKTEDILADFAAGVIARQSPALAGKMHVRTAVLDWRSRRLEPV